MKVWPPSLPPMRLATAIGASYFARSTASIKSRRPTFAVWPTKCSSIRIARWASSKPVAALHPAKAVNPQVTQAVKGVDNETRIPSFADRYLSFCSWAFARANSKLEADSHSAVAGLQTAAAETARTVERPGDLPSRRSRIAAHRWHSANSRRIGERTEGQNWTHGYLRRGMAHGRHEDSYR